MPELNESDSEQEIEMEESDANEEKQESSENEESEDTEEETEENHQTEVVHRNIYVQFPRKRPENAEAELRKVSDKIKFINFPRQKKARFCFVHCDTESDAIEVENLLRTTEICGFKLFVNRKRKIDDPEYRQKLKTKQIERRLAKRDAKRLKKQLKQKGEKKKKSSKVNKIVVSNIPQSCGMEQLREIFGSSVDFQYREKPNKIAFVTFSTAEEATKFIKKKPKVEEQELAVRPMLIVNRKKKQQRRRSGKKENKGEQSEAKEVTKEDIPAKIPDKSKNIKEKSKAGKKLAGVQKSKDKIKQNKTNKFTKKQKAGKINYVAVKKTLG